MTTFASHLVTGDHTSRPAATAVPSGTLYSCSTHSLIYQSDGANWSTWATLGASGGAWTTYTPALTATTTNPTLGSGAVAEGRYIQTGKTVTATIMIQFGTGANAGSGEYRISLPPVAANTAVMTTGCCFGVAGSYLPAKTFTVMRNSSTTVKLWDPATALYVTHSAGFSAGSQIWLQITYEAA